MSILPSSKKVQLLQDRLRSRSGPTQRASLGASSKRLTTRGGTGGGGGGGGGAAASSSSARAAGGAGGRGAGRGGGAAAAAEGSHLPSPEIYFPGNQEFFYHFLRACDSYALNLALARVLGAELARTTEPTAIAQRQQPPPQQRPKPPGEEEDGDAAGDPHGGGSAGAGAGADGGVGQQLTDPTHLARLKLLARFLGLLMFSPNWSNALPQLALLE